MALFVLVAVFLAVASVPCQVLGFDDDDGTNPGTYVAIAPKKVRPNLPYAVSLQIIKSPENEHTVRVEVRNYKNYTIGSTTVKRFPQGVPQTITIDKLSPEKLTSSGGSYKVYLKAETASGSRMLFEKERFVEFDSKSLSVHIQTDKAVYKPGTTVRYRVIVLNPDLTASKENITVKIVDPMRNVIKQFVDPKMSRGVFSSDLDLASEPPLGDWSIVVEKDGSEIFQKSFSVEKYVLPKFEVTVKAASYITNNDDLNLLIQAKYTYGKGVSGKAKVTVEEPQILSDFPRKKTVAALEAQSETIGALQRTVTLGENGEASVLFKNSQLKQQSLLRDATGTTLQVTCSVTEDLTGIQRNGTTEVPVHSNNMRLEISKFGQTFKSGLQYDAIVKLTQMDYTPMKGNFARNVQVRSRFYYQNKVMEKAEKIIKLDDNGIGIFELETPTNRTNLKIEARYDEKGKDYFDNTPHVWTIDVPSARSPTDSFLQLLPKQTNVPSAGSELSFAVKVTDNVTKVNYLVISRGYVVLAKDFSLKDREGSFSFMASSEMAPKSRLVVYAIRDSNQEILVDAADFKVEGLFVNKVSVQADRSEAQPGDSVKLTVKADPDSFVGLLAVDQSVLLLKSGNDITEKTVQNDIEQFDTTNAFVGEFDSVVVPQPAVFRRRKRAVVPVPPDWIKWRNEGLDASSVFSNAGLIVLTDAYLYADKPQALGLLRGYGGGFNGGAGGSVAEEAADMTFAMPAPAAPMMAKVMMPQAMSLQQAPIRVRSNFPETWIWFDAVVKNGSNQVEYEGTAPDTITSWIASAFAVNDITGLGVAPTTTKITTFNPFFIRLNLPYSVKRGEKFALQVLVFNYLDSEQQVTVTLKHEADAGFDFLQKDGSSKKAESKTSKSKTYNVRDISVPGGGASRAAYFPISPTKLGNIKLSVLAQAAAAGDAVEELLKVEPEGYRVERNVPFVVDLSSSNRSNSGRRRRRAAVAKFSKSVQLEYPSSNVVDGSKKVQVDVIGDIMGPILSNVDSFVRMPYGCGEQNMINFVPNIVVVRYLRATKPNKELEAKAIKNMEAGYQRELTYRRYDNSFSAFGQQDQFGSTWLTAFVVRSFKQAQPYIFIDGQLLKNSISFLNLQQNKDTGAFNERGRLVDRQIIQGGGTDQVSLTAYVLTALLENGVKNKKAQEYVENSFQNIKENPYALAVSTYALHLAGSGKRGDFLKTLEAHKVTEDDGSVHWGKKGERTPSSKVAEQRFFFQPKPADVEMTAYAVLSYLQAGDVAKAVPVVKWLTAQRNSLGGFSSTQDTVMALQALGSYAEKVYSPSVNITVDISNGEGNDDHQFKVDKNNAIVLQSVELSHPEEAAVNVSANGEGVAFVQVHYSYYRVGHFGDLPFNCSLHTEELRNGGQLKLDLCCTYAGEGSSSNMAVAEIEALTGQQFDREEVNQLTTVSGGGNILNADLQRAELENGDTKINLYFYSLDSTPACVTVHSDTVYEVADQKPAQVVVYDYYDPEKQVKLSYSGKKKTTLSETCPDCWPTEAGEKEKVPAKEHTTRRKRRSST